MWLRNLRKCVLGTEELYGVPPAFEVPGELDLLSASLTRCVWVSLRACFVCACVRACVYGYLCVRACACVLYVFVRVRVFVRVCVYVVVTLVQRSQMHTCG